MRSRTRAGPSSHSTRTAIGVGETGTGGHRVVEMAVGGVVGEERCGDAALRVARVPVGEHRLGDELDGVAGVRGLHRGPEPGDAAADDEHVRHVRPPRSERRAPHSLPH